MRHILFGDATTAEGLDTAILVKTDALRQQPIQSFYLDPLSKLGVDTSRIFAMNLKYNSANKAPAAEAKAYIQLLLPAIDKIGIKTLYIADSVYFKFLTGVKRVDTAHGYTFPCAVKGFEHITCVYGTNYMALSYSEQLQEKLDISIHTLAQVLGVSELSTVGEGVIKHAEYPKDVQAIKEFLTKLHTKKQLAVDIETFSLRHYTAGIASIAFAWDKHSGGSFLVDYTTSAFESAAIHELLKEFFLTYKGKLLFFNILFDVKVLIYQLFMDSPSDIRGMRKAIKLFEDADDAMFYAFLALNTTQDIEIGLKVLAYPYLGAWGVDVNDVRQIEPQALLEYNFKDTLGTMYVQEVYLPKATADDQMDYYHNMLKPSVGFALEMCIIGLPLSPERRDELYDHASTIQRNELRQLSANPYVITAVNQLQIDRWQAANAKLKTKINPLNQFYEPFKASSDKQKSMLLYDVMNMPVLTTTASGAPSASAKVIKRLVDLTDDPSKQSVLQRLVALSELSTLFTTFIPAFNNFAFTHESGQFAGSTFIAGSIHLTGTQSGRMSCKEPNLSNLPSGSEYGQAVKHIFVAPCGWLLAGADFAALEDKINAILTGDPNKIKIYSDDYDGHCLRAYSYYGHLMPLITDTSAESINSIKTLYPALRDKSKSPSFAMAYLGTYKTLVNNLGFTLEEAKALEKSYHTLYAASDAYADMLQLKASRDGYITLAFGLRLRTPVLARSVVGGRATPYQAIAEGRSAYNADSQSWGLLTNRAVIATRNKLLEAPQHIQDGIIFVNVIHDANYQLIRKDPEVIKWLNDNLIEQMQWTCEQIHHPDVPMAAELDLGTAWDTMKTLKNNASIEDIKEFLECL